MPKYEVRAEESFSLAALKALKKRENILNRYEKYKNKGSYGSYLKNGNNIPTKVKAVNITKYSLQFPNLVCMAHLYDSATSNNVIATLRKKHLPCMVTFKRRGKEFSTYWLDPSVPRYYGRWTLVPNEDQYSQYKTAVQACIQKNWTGDLSAMQAALELEVKVLPVS
jgi:hypothetical protein